jgi:hypothetical protein
MKAIALFIAVWAGFLSAGAQTKSEKHISFSGKESVKLDIQITDSIDIRTWNKNEVYAVSLVNINENRDNDAYQITYDESGSSVGIKAGFKKDYFKGKDNCCTKSEITWHIYIPENTTLYVETINGNTTITGRTKQMNVKTISGFVDLAVPASENADLEFSTISGTVFTDHSFGAETVSSGITSVIKEKLNQGGPLIKLATISGDIFFRRAE